MYLNDDFLIKIFMKIADCIKCDLFSIFVVFFHFDWEIGY